MAMTMWVNGHAYEHDRLSLHDLLTQLNLHQQRVAIEVNGDVIPRSQHRDFFVHDGDRIEIVRAIGGG